LNVPDALQVQTIIKYTLAFGYLLRCSTDFAVTLMTLDKYRRLRGDMIEMFKMVTGKYDPDSCIKLKYVNHPGT